MGNRKEREANVNEDREDNEENKWAGSGDRRRGGRVSCSVSEVNFDLERH